MLTRPIQLAHDDGWLTDITEQPDLGLLVIVTAPSGRSWTTVKPSVEAAVAVSRRIRQDQAP